MMSLYLCFFVGANGISILEGVAAQLHCCDGHHHLHDFARFVFRMDDLDIHAPEVIESGSKNIDGFIFVMLDSEFYPGREWQIIRCR